MTKLLSQYFHCTALGIYLWLYSCSLIAWPKLSCVYCTGKASGWFLRHEMSDLFWKVRMAKMRVLGWLDAFGAVKLALKYSCK